MNTPPLHVTTDPSAVALVNGVQLRKVIAPITKERAPQDQTGSLLRTKHPLPTSIAIDLDRP